MLPVGVIGAGAGGLALALALTQKGLPVVVLERSQTLREGGGAIILWSNGTAVLKGLGVLEELETFGRVVKRGELRAWDGRLLTSIPVAALAKHVGSPSLVVWRGSLLRALFEKLPPELVRFGAEVMQFEEEEAGVRVVLQDGSTELFSVLIGADGLNSRIRAMLIQDGPPRSAQQDAWVGVARGLEWASNLETTVGSLGRGLRFWHVPLNRSTAYWYGILDTRLLPQTPQSLLELKQIFRGWHAPIPELIAATAPVDVIKTPIRDRIPIQHWGKGRITLLGDAAHPVTPDLGQGACQALESAAVLAVELLQQGPCIGALQSYARTRQPRAAGVTRLSYLSSRSTMPLNSSLCGLRDLALTISPKEVPLLQLGWLFGLAE